MEDWNMQRHHDCQNERLPTYPFRDKGPLARKALSLREHLVQSMIHGVPITDAWLERFADELSVLCDQCDAMESAAIPLRGQVVRLRPALVLVEGGK